MDSVLKQYSIIITIISISVIIAIDFILITFMFKLISKSIENTSHRHMNNLYLQESIHLYDPRLNNKNNASAKFILTIFKINTTLQLLVARFGYFGSIQIVCLYS